MTIKAIIKSTVYSGGQIISVGRYYGRDDKIKIYEFIGDESAGLAKIKTMQNAGFDFQHCIVREAPKR